MNESKLLSLLKRLEGLQTADTVSRTLQLSRQSAINLISKLKKQGYITTTGGGKQKRIYKITIRKQFPKKKGMFDIINKHSKMKIAPWFDHQVYGEYTAEDALINAIQTKQFRLILSSLKLFNHITNWSKLYKLAKRNDCWQKIAGLYELARNNFKVRKMPKRYTKYQPKKWQQITKLKKKNFPTISNRWKIYISFNEKDLEEIQ